MVTYGDDPPKWTGDNEGARRLRETTEARRKELWAQVETAAGSPWFLGERMGAIDLYVAVMTNWRPGRKWFAAHAPRVMAIAEKTAATPKVAAVLRRNF